MEAITLKLKWNDPKKTLPTDESVVCLLTIKNEDGSVSATDLPFALIDGEWNEIEGMPRPWFLQSDARVIAWAEKPEIKIEPYTGE